MHIDNREDICTVCSKKWKHRVRYIFCENYPFIVKEAEFITAHAGCRSLIRKQRELEDELLKIEWKLFELCCDK